MAKIKHNNIIDTINEIWDDAKKRGVALLVNEDEIYSGRTIKVKKQELINLGMCEYLGLGLDERLKKGAIEYIEKYGLQFVVSRGYVTSKINIELEQTLSSIFHGNVIVASSTSLGHIGVIPSIIRDEDAIILDHQVHASIQHAVQMIKPRGVTVEMIRHSNLEMLELKICELKDRHSKIWYMIDGVYSMFGDFAPIKEIETLLNKYEQFYLYVDDAHGMSWTGKHGSGYVLSQISLHPQMVLSTTLGKGFGVGGGIFVFPEGEIFNKFKNFGGALFFSAPLIPPAIGAALASAKIHLTDEIYSMQKDLADKIKYCNELLSKTQLPLFSSNQSPIFFIGMGMPGVGYNMVKRLMNEGFFINLAVFPGVPVKNTGLRFTISRYLKKDDIKNLINAIEYHYPLALKEENSTQNEVRKAFKLPFVEEKHKVTNFSQPDDLRIHLEYSILNINKEEWNSLLGKNGSFDWDGLKFLEEIFLENKQLEFKWNFCYLIIKDSNNIPLLATFFTTSLWKEDMLAPPSVSIKIEEKRKTQPFYLTSTTISLGSFMTEGDHIYLNKNNPLWKSAFSFLLKAMEEQQEKVSASTIILRDFEDNEEEVKQYLVDRGFVKVNMPEVAVIENNVWENYDEYLSKLSLRARRHVKYDILKNEHFFSIEIVNNCSDKEVEYLYKLYQNVGARNFDVNIFEYPLELFKKMNSSPNWEFVIIRLKKEYEKREENLPIGVIFGYKGENFYSPLLVGIDYDFIKPYKIYKQTLFQMVKRGRDLGKEKVYLGFTATLEKKKLGATIIPKVAYVQATDNFNMELIGLISAEKQ